MIHAKFVTGYQHENHHHGALYVSLSPVLISSGILMTAMTSKIIDQQNIADS
jgi:hypothetical protein